MGKYRKPAHKRGIFKRKTGGGRYMVTAKADRGSGVTLAPAPNLLKNLLSAMGFAIKKRGNR